VVLGHPGFWLADPRTTVDAARLVHAEEGFRLLRPLPTVGHVAGKTRVVDVVDKGKEKGALLYLEKDLRDVETGAVIALETRTLMLRGDGGFAGPCGRARRVPPPPEGRPDSVIEIPTRPEQALFYRLNGDPNPLHIDPAIAARAGFPRPILHGLCTFGIACQALLRVVAPTGRNRLTAMSARFSAPVYPGETIRVEAWPGGTFQARVVERDVIVLSHGQAEIE
jgi:acyl dehydratase